MAADLRAQPAKVVFNAAEEVRDLVPWSALTTCVL
jgi:hypothetical protein